MDNQVTPTPTSAQAPTTEQTAPSATGGVRVVAPATSEAPAAAGQSQPHKSTYNPQVPAPQIINGVKVYPTSYIPARAELSYPQKMLVEMKALHIEVVHIVVFFLVILSLFARPWKRPNLR